MWHGPKKLRKIFLIKKKKAEVVKINFNNCLNENKHDMCHMVAETASDKLDETKTKQVNG